MRTEKDLIDLLKKRNPLKRSYAVTFKTGGDLQCSVGFISGFGTYCSLLDNCYRGFLQGPYLTKTMFPAIWLFTMTDQQSKLESMQDLIVGLNATEVYEYTHDGHGNKMHLYLAQREFFNYDYMYDICEQQMKKEGSL